MQDAEKDNTEWSVGWGIMSPLPSINTPIVPTITMGTTSSITATTTDTTSIGIGTAVIGTSSTLHSVDVGATPTTTRARSFTGIITTDTSPSPGLSSVPQASDIAASKLGLAQPQQQPQQQQQPTLHQLQPLQTMALLQEQPVVVDRTPLHTPHPVTYGWTSTQSGDDKVGGVGVAGDAEVGMGGGKVGTSPAKVTSGQEGGMRSSALLSAAASSTFITPTVSQVT